MTNLGTIAVKLMATSTVFEKQMERAYQRVEALDGGLKRLHDTMSMVNGTSIKVGNSGMKQLRESTEKTAKSVVSSFTAMGDKMVNFGRMLGIFVLAPMLYFGKKAVSAFVGFDQSMRNVNSVALETEEQFMRTSNAVREMSLEFGKSPKEMADALYEINQATFLGSEGLQVLRAAAIASRAGLAGMNESAQAITAILNAYGMSAAGAADVTDVMAETVKRGVVTFSDLSKDMGVVAATASAARVDFSEVGAAIATMTRGGIESAEAFTSLNRMFMRLIQGTKPLDALFATTKYGTASMMLQTEGLAKTMKFLQEQTGGSTQLLTDLGFRIRDLKAALALTRNEGKDFAEDLDNIDKVSTRVGSGMVMFAEQSKSLGVQLDKLKTQANDLFISVGQTISKEFSVGISILKDFFSALKLIPEPIVKMVAGMTVLLAVFIPSITLLGVLVKSIGILTITLKPVALAVGAFSTALFGLPAIAVAGVAALAGLLAFLPNLISRFEETSESAQELQSMLKFSEDTYRGQVEKRLQGMVIDPGRKEKELRESKRFQEATIEEQEKMLDTLFANELEFDRKARALLGGRYAEVVKEAEKTAKELAEQQKKVLEQAKTQRDLEEQQAAEQYRIDSIKKLYQLEDDRGKAAFDRLSIEEQIASVKERQSRAEAMVRIAMKPEEFFPQAEELMKTSNILDTLRNKYNDMVKSSSEALKNKIEEYKYEKSSNAEKLAIIAQRRADIMEKLNTATQLQSFELGNQLMTLREMEDSLKKQVQTRYDLAGANLGSQEDVAAIQRLRNEALNFDRSPGAEGAEQDAAILDKIASNTAVETSNSSAILKALRELVRIFGNGIGELETVPIN